MFAGWRAEGGVPKVVRAAEVKAVEGGGGAPRDLGKLVCDASVKGLNWLRHARFVWGRGLGKSGRGRYWADLNGEHWSSDCRGGMQAKKKKRNQKISTEKIRLGWNDVTGGVGRGKGNSLKVSQGCFLALHDGILAKAPDSILGKMAGAALPSLCPLAPRLGFKEWIQGGGSRSAAASGIWLAAFDCRAGYDQEDLSGLEGRQVGIAVYRWMCL